MRTLVPCAADGHVRMKHNLGSIYDKLEAVYSKGRRKHRENPDSKQMCCMWSTDDPPDIIDETDPICDIEDTFGIQISEDEALELYDMHLNQAAQKILDITRDQC
jgi:hypothetical protein